MWSIALSIEDLEWFVRRGRSEAAISPACCRHLPTLPPGSVPDSCYGGVGAGSCSRRPIEPHLSRPPHSCHSRSLSGRRI